ncbi:MAG: M23 family metallopeptidase [Candidatus Staskawiczbacteria bacterium]|nr:M23 family metallopeptidase [Candidatus Staskawiczbacteria bacterium]
MIGIKVTWLSAKDMRKRANFRGLLKSPSFYFGLIAVVLFSSVYASCDSSANNGNLANSQIVFFNPFFNKYSNGVSSGSADTLFSSQANAIPLETPDLKIMQDNTLCAISAPCVVSGKVLGDVFGGNNQNKKDVVDYVVQLGDTLRSIADANNVSVNTLTWANEITSSSSVKVGQSLTILPIDGVLHVVKSGDTMSAIASRYKAKSDDIISYNDLANQDDIYIGDILIIPGGVMPKKASSIINAQAPLADNFFIFPTQGSVTQGLHYMNAIDVANKCGTPVYAAASGTVERAVYNNSWNLGMGNYVTILHANSTVTYYGHFEVVFVKPGDHVTVGDRIGLMGRTGNATGCHVHFQVMGARNPLTKYPVGSKISY